MRRLQARVVVSGNAFVDIYADDLSGAQWKDVARACAVAASALGDGYQIDFQGMNIKCDSAEDLKEIAEHLANKLPKPIAVDAAVSALSKEDPR